MNQKKLTTVLIAFLFYMFFPHAYAGSSLAQSCRAYGGSLLTDVKIKNYNFTTTTKFLNVRTSNSTTAWYGVETQMASFLYDMAKTARLTGESVDICYNPSGAYLLGIEWTRPAN